MLKETVELTAGPASEVILLILSFLILPFLLLIPESQ